MRTLVYWAVASLLAGTCLLSPAPAQQSPPLPPSLLDSSAVVSDAESGELATSDLAPSPAPSGLHSEFAELGPPDAPLAAAVGRSSWESYCAGCGCGDDCGGGCDCGCDLRVPPPCPTFDCCGNPIIDHRWTLTADALILQKVGPTPMLLASNLTTENFDATQLDWGTATGPRLSLICHGEDAWDLEANVFLVDHWDATADTSAFPQLRIPSPGPIQFFSAPNGSGYDYRTRIFSEELNVRRRMSDRWTLLAGFRAVQLNEGLTANQDNAPLYTVDTANRMFGAQIGSAHSLCLSSRLSVDAVFKAGIFGNSAEQVTTDVTGVLANNSANQVLYAKRGHVAFLGEIALTGTLQLTEHLAARGGYQLIWVDQVALASDQLGVNAFQIDPMTALRGIDATGAPFYHGALAGLEARW